MVVRKGSAKDLSLTEQDNILENLFPEGTIPPEQDEEYEEPEWLGDYNINKYNPDYEEE